MEDVPRLSRLRLTGRISEATRRAFDQTPIRALVALDCADGSSPVAAMSFVDQLLQKPVPDDGGYGPVFRLRLPRWTDEWSQAMSRTEAHVKRLRVETRMVDEVAAIDLRGIRKMERLTLVGMDTPALYVTNLAPTLESIDLEQCALGSLKLSNGFATLRCHEMTRFEELIVSAPNPVFRRLHLLTGGPNHSHPNEAFTYGPEELVFNNLGDVEEISLQYGMGIRTVVINGEHPKLKEVTYIPKSTRSLTSNGRKLEGEWHPGGRWRRDR